MFKVFLCTTAVTENALKFYHVRTIAKAAHILPNKSICTFFLFQITLFIKMATRGSLIVKAKLAEHAQRYNDMCEIMKRVVEMGNDLNNDERNLLSSAYKRSSEKKRQSWRVLCNIEKSAKFDPDARIYVLKALREKVVGDLEKGCLEVIELIDNYLLKASNPNEAVLFYQKMKGDYYRYMSEVITIPDKRKKLINHANIAYSTAVSVSDRLDLLNPISLGLVLNYAVFLNDIMHNQKKAILLAQSALNDAVSQINKLQNDAYKDATIIMQMLKDNIKLWRNTVYAAAEEEKTETEDPT